jgi:hypothetical protein
MKGWPRFLIVMLAALFPPAEEAQADEVFEFVKFMCCEDLNYLEIEPVMIMNARDYAALGDPDLVAIFDRERESGQVAAIRECKLGSTVFSLQSNWRRPPTSTGASGGAWNEELEVRLNDNRFAVFVAGSWSVPFRMIASDGDLTVCSQTGGRMGEFDMTCKEFGLRQWLEAPETFRVGR